MDRRGFLKTAGAAGIGSALAAVKAIADPNIAEPNASGKADEPKYPQLPRRKLGKTGIEVPCLAYGLCFDVENKQITLRKALQLGVTFWDTAADYGTSETGIGKFLSKEPDIRKDLLIATKTTEVPPTKDFEASLQSSLEKMKVGYVDLFFGIHGMNNPEQLTDELKRWAQDAKKRKLIRFFGFSTHSNMAKCLSAASKLDWIDVILTYYNFRVMQQDEMQDAVEACHKAGIGLIAMKTQAKAIETEQDRKLTEHFIKSGFTEGQAKIKAVLQDERICSACVGRDNLEHLTLNAAAVMDKTELSQTDMDFLAEYAQATCTGHCLGCAEICGSAMPDVPYIRDIMRYLMYYSSYGEHDRARKLFAQIPGKVRNRLHRMDYSLAEARCPQHLPIGKLIAEAINKLA